MTQVPCANPKLLPELIKEAYALKQEADRIKARLAEVNQTISASVTFPPDKNTVTGVAANLICKVSKKENLKWDQAKLNQARATLGDELFLSLFSYEWKHQSKPVLDNFLQHNGQAKPVLDALTITESFSVTVEEKAA